MAKRQKIDRGYQTRLEEFEKRLALLKINYEKYFTGIEKIEPLKERMAIQRTMRDLLREPCNNTRQRHRLMMLKARFNSYMNYWQRNLVMIERGTHPKMKFRQALADRNTTAIEDRASQVRAQRSQQLAREDKAYQMVFDKYLEARSACGQNTELGFNSMRETLKNQARTIKATYKCTSVKFKVVVEDGKAKVKAVPVT
ncbi:MAG: MXAN_5187 C-terminal domain-containing protein [Myxococcota bacterium]|nr:MXAN_5187 C-terminal domain-containing protein [Myxococcota bacterium]